MRNAWREQQLRQVFRTALGRRRERTVETTGEDIARSDIVVRRHDEMRQLVLGGALPHDCCVFADDADWSEVGEQFHLRGARSPGPPVGEVDDFTLLRTIDGAVRLLDEAAQGRIPVVSPRLTLVVMPEECQSIPVTAPNDWNQKGCDNRSTNSSRP